jgi:DNA gyrase inhibitor GyrI
MTDFQEIEREEIAVQFVRGRDELADIRRTWNGLESGTLPGGRYLRARLHGDPPAVYERIGPTFEELTRQAKPDVSRPSLEHYRRHDEIDLLLPI